MEKKFIIRLREAHERSGLTAYAVAKRLGLSQTTVRKYVDQDEVISTYVPGVVVKLANFYGVNWRDPAIVEEVTEEGELPPGIESTLLTA